MAQFNKEVVMTVTSDDRTWLSFSNHMLTEIHNIMLEENAESLVNTYTGEVIDEVDVEKAVGVIESLINAQEEWGWKLV